MLNVLHDRLTRPSGRVAIHAMLDQVLANGPIWAFFHWIPPYPLNPAGEIVALNR